MSTDTRNLMSVSIPRPLKADLFLLFPLAGYSRAVSLLSATCVPCSSGAGQKSTLSVQICHWKIQHVGTTGAQVKLIEESTHMQP